MGEPSRRIQRYFQFCIAGFGLAATATGLTTFTPMTRAATLGSTAVVAVVGVLVVYWRRTHVGAECAEWIPEGRDSIRYVRNETELRRVSKLDATYFGEHAVDFHGLRGWWRRYPQGVVILRIQGKLAGAIGLWPLTEEIFRRISNGAIDEPAINAVDIVSSEDEVPRRYWYFGDIVMAPEFKDRRQSLRLMEGATRLWLRDGRLAPMVSMVGYGYSDKGIALLKKLEFDSEVVSPSDYPVYERTATIAELANDLHVRIVAPQRHVGPAEPPEIEGEGGATPPSSTFLR